VLASASADDLAAWRRFVERAGASSVAAWLSPRALVACMLGDTRFAAAALETLRAPDSPAALQVTAAFPEAAALAATAPPQVEHDPPLVEKRGLRAEPRPLLDHVATRILGTKLAGLEAGDLARFQVAGRPGLSQATFDELSGVARRVLDAGLGPALRAAIIHLDIAKTADAALRAAWTAQGVSLEVHNEAAAAILRANERSRSWGLPPTLQKLAIAWIEAHGLAGQHVRGEGPILMFAPIVSALRELGPALGRILRAEPHDAIKLALEGLHVLNACDTAAVREGLLDDALLGKLARVRDQLLIVAAQAGFTEPHEALQALAPAPTHAALVERLRSLRAGRQAAGESIHAIEAAVAAIGDQELAALAPALATCQLWYCEAATSALSPGAQLGILAAAVGAARQSGIDTSRPWHAQLRPLLARLSGNDARYRLRLIEAALAQHSLRELLTGNAALGPLGALSMRLASTTTPDAIVIDFVDTSESAALITLLGIYETRSQAQFHHMLKALCDLYGLRKDDFDRVANEASYLASMNAARGDKERMLDHVKPGRIVEIGPGGGVVLDLLEARFPEAEIIGVDVSREVITALEARTGHRWRVVHGAAEALPEVAHDVDTVVLCSILHEVYSYAGFSMAAVERVIKAAWASLRQGGRIVIRDGVRPPDGTRRIRFLAPDARPTFDLYVAQFEGRAIQYGAIGDRVELSSADAMEFLYTYTWGPASFPYEVRELYGIMTYDAYVAALLTWCDGARVVGIPAAQRSYLQAGYRDHLAGKIELTDERDVPVELPDSNCLIVIEKP
jgi:SAM-dependent methyltransferase